MSVDSVFMPQSIRNGKGGYWATSFGNSASGLGKAETVVGLQGGLASVGGAVSQERAGRWAAAQGGWAVLSEVGGAGRSSLWDSWRLSSSTAHGDRFCK